MIYKFWETKRIFEDGYLFTTKKKCRQNQEWWWWYTKFGRRENTPDYNFKKISPDFAKRKFFGVGIEKKRRKKQTQISQRLFCPILFVQ